MDNKTYSQNLAAMSKQMQYLRLNGFPGLCSDFGEIIKLNSFMEWTNQNVNQVSENTSEYGMNGEELRVKLPFAGTNLTVRLFFNLHEPWVPPDMIFSDSKFMKKMISEDLDNLVPSLNSWNYLSEDIIMQLLIQLHKLYKRYQLECLEAEEVLHFEYESLMKNLGIGEDDIELSLSGGSGWLASLLLRLPLNLNDVPPTLTDSNPGQPTCLLHVSIKRSNGSFTPKLYLSPQVEALIGNSSTLGLPSVPPGTSLTDYITSILKLLEDRVKSLVLSFEIKKQLTAQLLCCMGTAMLEYDAEKFSKLTFLLDWQHFNFLLIVSLPDNFPKNPPILSLRSVYHLVSGTTPFTKTIPEVKIPSPSTPEEMVTIIKSAVMNYLPTFKASSLSYSK